MLAGSCLTEECIEGIITATDCLVTWHLAIRLDSMLEAKELPARIANLHTSLTKVKAKDLTHDDKEDRSVEGGSKL
jgi:hypothetical protein